MKNFIICVLVLLATSSCIAVKGYDKIYLNDEEMKLVAKGIERSELNFQLYRESAAGANGGKSGGGCGCN